MTQNETVLEHCRDVTGAPAKAMPVRSEYFTKYSQLPVTRKMFEHFSNAVVVAFKQCHYFFPNYRKLAVASYGI